MYSHSPQSTSCLACLLVVLIPHLGLSGSQAQDLPPPQNATEILKELDKVDQGAKSKVENRRSAAISQIQGAGNSGSAAVDLYLKALANTKFLESPQDYVEWTRKNQELLHSLSFQNAAQLQMRYLAMALRRDEKHDAYSQIPECLAYLGTLSSDKSLRQSPSDSSGGSAQSGPQLRVQKKAVAAPTSTDKPYPEAIALINQPVNKSSVVEWFQIFDLLPDKDFAPSAGNYESIMEKNIRSPLKAMKDPRIIQTWDVQIAQETAAATESNSKQQADTFNQTRLPELLFRKAKDTAAIGQSNRALDQIMVLIRNYPENPLTQGWITMARGLLTNPPVASADVVPQTNVGAMAPAPVTTNSSAPGTAASAPTLPAPPTPITPAPASAQ